VEIQIHSEVLAESKWHEYAVRFLFGGLITALAGIIAKKFGPEIGGLFLAFPAIFPASATLIEKHEKQEKERLRLKGTKRAAEAVSVDAASAAIGTIGLACFALLVWKAIPDHTPWLVLLEAALLWMGLSFLLWQIRKRFAVYRRRNKRAHTTSKRATLPAD
jgi:uncharacterized protein DUF3147